LFQKEETRELLSKVKEALEKYSTAGFIPRRKALDLLKEVNDLSHSLDSSTHNRPSI